MLAFTPGEPAGIGPDLAVQLAQLPRDYNLVAFADPDLLLQRADTIGLPIRLNENLDQIERTQGTLSIHPVPLQGRVRLGVPSLNSASYVLETIRTATRSCLNGQYQALVTGPIHKGVINDAGEAGLICKRSGDGIQQVPFSGHTEYLQELCDAEEVVMMLASPPSTTKPPLRVALATTHLPLNRVSQAITPDKLEKIISILHHGLIEHCDIADPTILVTGLNPHAGEDGYLGREEIEVINPVLERMRNHGMKLIGPLPADTLFTPKVLSQGDVVLAMYHDQGLPVLKHYSFGQGVNITLGLPFLRTSVDHGTALDLAGSGKAEIGSLRQAIAVVLQS